MELGSKHVGERRPAGSALAILEPMGAVGTEEILHAGPGIGQVRSFSPFPLEASGNSHMLTHILKGRGELADPVPSR